MSRTIYCSYIKGFLLLLLIAYVSAQLYEFDGIIFGRANLKETFVTLYGETLESCQQHCADRPNCVALNFHTKYPFECSLNYDDDEDLDVRFGWVHQEWLDQDIETPCDECYYNQTCDRSTRTCVYRECEPVKNSNEYIPLGNGNAVGSRILLACPFNAYPDLPAHLDIWPVTGVCQDNGEWSFPWRPKCIQYRSVCQKYHTGPGSIPGAKNWSNFLQRDIMLISGPCGVNDSMISSSSNFDRFYSAHWVDFDYTHDTWVPAQGDENPYIQVQFDRLTNVRGMKIRGRTTQLSSQFPTLLNVTYNSDCSQGVLDSFVRNRTGGAIFTGNNDSTTIVEHMFETPINARCVRVNVLEYINTLPSPFATDYFGMKLDLFGTALLPSL